MMQHLHHVFLPARKHRLYAGGIILPNAVGAASAGFTREAVNSDWYKTLKKAPFNPPKWIFPIAWTSLYSMMGAASVMVYKSAQANGALTADGKTALLLYAGQLAINGCWSPIFFKYKQNGAAVLWILLLDAAVAATTKKFLEVDQTAGYLIVPYMGWCMFATLLSYSIWLLNYDNKSNTE